MDTLKRRRSSTKGKITRVQNFLETTPDAQEKALRTRLEGLEEAWKDYNSIHDEILEVGEDADIDGQEADYISLEIKFYDIKTHILDRLSELIIPNSTPPSAFPNPNYTSSTGVDIRLPRITLPTFSGNALEWPSFHDLFSSVVHNNSLLSSTQKLHYLRNSLSGDAANLIQSIDITEANYSVAWNLLVDRYQNERLLVQCNLKSLFQLKALTTESASGIRHLVDNTVKHCRALNALGIETDQWDPILVFMVAEKLDGDTRRQWEQSSSGKEFPKFSALQEFLEQRCRAIDAVGARATSKPQFQPSLQKEIAINKSFQRATHFVSPLRNSVSCQICTGNHVIYKCPEFLKLSDQDKTATVRKLNLCFNCLRAGHSSKQCSSKNSCYKCKARHHTILHYQRPLNPQQQQEPLVKENTSPTNSVSMHFSNDSVNKEVLLQTVVLKVQDASGQFHQCRAVLDSGSQSSFVTEGLAQKLGLRRYKTNVQIFGICQTDSGHSSGMVELKLSSNLSAFSITVDALILRNVTGVLPKQQINIEQWAHIYNLQLADPEFHKPKNIDILLGANVYHQIMLDGKISGTTGQPSAFNTNFGWVLSGVVGQTNNRTNQSMVHLCSIDIQDQLRQFWELEEIPKSKSALMTLEERQCEDLFQSSYTRDSTGRFCVSLPLKEETEPLGYSKEIAIKRFNQIETKLSRFPHFQREYNRFMQEYLDLNQMELVPLEDRQENPPETNYLPHHFVLKQSSTTTALRVVFDASAKTSTGVSLNDKLMVGHKLQDDLYDILLRFRIHRYALTADIEKMYRQIAVSQKDADIQRILWRPSPSQPIEEYRLTTVTYGTASAPYLAVRTLQQLATEDGDQFPLAKNVALQDFYMDDMMTGANSIDSGLELQAQLLNLMTNGGFNLRKWSSNEPALLQSLPEEARETHLPLEIETDQGVKALGLHWQPSSDTFFFKVSLDLDPGTPSKRTILSDVSKLFDPIGWLSPVLITGKLIIQKLWIAGVSWDEKLAPILQIEWLKFREALFSIQAIRIPRWVVCNDCVSFQLHGFCDASELAYAAVVYLRTHSVFGETSVHLLTSKTRVAPVKQVSLPRLELCGALLLAKLLRRTEATLNITLESIYAWTDSTVVLYWIRETSRRWKTFVANRVSEIQDLVSPEKWHHISTTENPADAASRGLRPQELENNALWWNGPQWLNLREDKWITKSIISYSQEIEMEEKTVKTFFAAPKVEWDLICRFSSLNRLTRVTAYVLRFTHNAKPGQCEKLYGPLSTKEINQALLACVKIVQSTEFPKVVESIKRDKVIPSNLQSLNPFIDEGGLIRVGGRIRYAKLPYDQRFPILLPKQHHLSELIIRDIHIKGLHSGPQATLANLRTKFWIVDGRNVVRHIIFKCQKCFRDRRITSHQLMGDLPAHRLEPARPFVRCGVDFGGPFVIKTMKGRGGKQLKAYICLFVCFTTKAIHLELVGDLTTEACIAAVRRFAARRGKPSDIYSDNGSNLVGANNELRHLKQICQSQLFNETISESLSVEGIAWHFIPANAPHFGGLWEAGIKSTKTHLRKVVGEAILTYEEFYTVLVQIEACLNSRPIAPLSSDPSDVRALTPGHFLTGDALSACPDPDLSELKISTLSRWQLVQQISQSFWKRWQNDYLSSLQQRKKWNTKSQNVKVGDLVVVKEDNLPPLRWAKGRVTETHPGKDGGVRVVTVRTATGLYRRPIVKLAVIPV